MLPHEKPQDKLQFFPGYVFTSQWHMLRAKIGTVIKVSTLTAFIRLCPIPIGDGPSFCVPTQIMVSNQFMRISGFAIIFNHQQIPISFPSPMLGRGK